jgi:hypothetical protein
VWLRCADRRPLLSSDRWNRVLAERIDEALGRRELDLAAFVFLPACARLVVVQRGVRVSLPRLVYVMKRTFSQWVRKDLHRGDDPLRRTLTVRDASGLYRFRFWEPGPAEVRALDAPGALLETIEALHASPVEAGLCATPGQWKWSSWRHYHLPGQPRDPDLPRVCALPHALSPASATD